MTVPYGMLPAEGGINQQQQNNLRRMRYRANAAQGVYPYAQEGSAIAQQTGAASAGAQAQQAQSQPAPQPTFAELQAQGRARPAPPPPMPPQMQGLQQQLYATTGQLLANPNTYRSDDVLRASQRLAANIDDDFNVRVQAINEDMARRGLTSSSIRGGRLYDTEVGRRSAKIDLADRLVQQQAEREDQARAQAVAQALGLYRTDIDERNTALARELQAALGFGGLDLQREEGAAERALRERLAQSSNATALAGLQSERELRLRELDDAMKRFGQEYGLRERQFEDDRTRYLKDLEERQRQFNQSLGFNQNELNQRGLLDLLRLIGVDVVDYGGGAFGNPAGGGVSGSSTGGGGGLADLLLGGGGGGGYGNPMVLPRVAQDDAGARYGYRGAFPDNPDARYGYRGAFPDNPDVRMGYRGLYGSV